MDKTGKVVVPLKYNSASVCFIEGLAEVRLNNKCGFVDKNGNEVVPLIYDSCGYFIDGLVLVRLNGKSGFVDKMGNEVVPIIYNNCRAFHNGLALVEYKNRLLFIDKMNTEVFKYDLIKEFPLKEYCAVSINGKWGIIDVDYDVVISLIYDEVKDVYLIDCHPDNPNIVATPSNSNVCAKVILKNKEFEIGVNIYKK